MTIESACYAALSGDSDVQASVGNGDSPETYRIYPDVAPDDVARPFIIYSLIHGERPVAFDGVANLRNGHVQIDVYADTLSAARTLADHAVDALEAGANLGSATDSSGYEEDINLHRIIIDASLWE